MMVERIKTLTHQGFYNGLTFHRVIEGFMAQGGDPKGTGEGGSTLPDVKAEFNDLPHVRGAVAAARASDEDSANSQFYIMFQPNLKLDKHYTVFGRVVSGMAYVDAIQRGEPPANPTRILRATLGQRSRCQRAAAGADAGAARRSGAERRSRRAPLTPSADDAQEAVRRPPLRGGRGREAADARRSVRFRSAAGVASRSARRPRAIPRGCSSCAGRRCTIASWPICRASCAPAIAWSSTTRA